MSQWTPVFHQKITNRPHISHQWTPVFTTRKPWTPVVHHKISNEPPIDHQWIPVFHQFLTDHKWTTQKSPANTCIYQCFTTHQWTTQKPPVDNCISPVFHNYTTKRPHIKHQSKHVFHQSTHVFHQYFTSITNAVWVKVAQVYFSFL